MAYQGAVQIKYRDLHGEVPAAGMHDWLALSQPIAMSCA